MIRMPSHRCRGLLVLGAVLVLAGADMPALAQPNLRSTFPGRRIGGGTRGECSARVLANLVPDSSVFSPGSSRVLGILEGPTANPRPVLISFQAQAAGSGASAPRRTVTLPAAAAGVVLFRQPDAPLPLRWESTYQCDGASTTANDDPLAFVSASSPPALSLLVSDPSAEDRQLQQTLKTLLKACGSTVPRQQIAQGFGLGDAIKDDWPAQLPVRCLN
jgi:hypothetical protein